MTDHYDALETREPAEREADLFSRLPDVLRKAMAAPAYAERLRGIDPAGVTSRAALARLPLLRKSDLPALHKAAPPFGGFVSGRSRLVWAAVYIAGPDLRAGGHPCRSLARRPGAVRRGLPARRRRAEHLQLSPDAGRLHFRCLGAGARLRGHSGRPRQYRGAVRADRGLSPGRLQRHPGFPENPARRRSSAGRDVSSIKRALVSGAAFPTSLQEEIKSRGVDAYQAFGTADLGLIAFETAAREGMVVNEDLILEIVRPGTGDPVAPGDVGEIVVTSLDPHHPWIRLALGDLTAALPGQSPCGRSNMRIKGWMGRADQTTKVKGMFVRPEQIAEIGKRHPELGRLRLVVTREGETDVMTLRCECASPGR